MVKESTTAACPTTDQWRQWLAESLPDDQFQIFDQHLTNCDACQKKLDELTSQTSWSWLAADFEIETTDRPESLTIDIPGIEILAEAGRGGHGVVFQARQERLSRMVAIKLLRHGIAASDNERARILTEAESLARLQHPNILQIHTTGESNGCPYLVMEWANSGSLAEQLDGTPWKPERVVALIETMARALHIAHGAGVIHRDFKPENILMQSMHGVEIPKISDFGLAKLADTPNGRTTSMQVLGTPNYMSPEQAGGGDKQIGPATDVYALGVVTYELLTGRPPFVADTPFETLLRVRDDEPLPPRKLQPRIPSDLETICLHCLHKDPKRRYTSALELADDLQRFREGRPIMARPVSNVEKAGKWIRRHPLRSMLVLLVGLAIVGGIITWQEFNRRTLAARQTARAQAMVEGLLVCEHSEAPQLLSEFAPVRALAGDYLVEKHRGTEPKSKQRLNAALALLPVEPNLLPEILDYVPTATPSELVLIRSQVQDCSREQIAKFWSMVQDAERPLGERLRAAAMLVTLAPSNEQWKKVGRTVADALVAENPIYVGGWAAAFKPVRQSLVEPLSQIAQDANYSEAMRTTAANIVADFATDLGRDLARDFLELEPKPALALLPAIKKLADPTRATWKMVLQSLADPKADEPAKDTAAKRRVRAAIGLWHLNDPEPIERILAMTGPDVRDRYFLIELMAQMDIAAEYVIGRALHAQNVVTRRSALLALGDYTPIQLPIKRRDELRLDLERVFTTDPDPGVHGTIDWLVGQAWKAKGWPPPLPQSDDPAKGRGWYVTPSGTAMAVIQGPIEFTMGSEPTEPHHAGGEERSQRRMTHSYAIATREVTVAEFGEFLKANPTVSYNPPGPDDRKPDHAARRMSWYAAMQYCRWLCECEKVPEHEIPYPPMDQIHDPMAFPPRFLQRTGYRLPTEEEWENACRCNTTTPRFYGFDRNQLYRFAWLLGNAEDACRAPGLLRPNDVGLFDIYGNVWEWTQPAPHRPFEANSLLPTLIHMETPYRPNPNVSTDALIARGGSYIYHAPFVRSAKRYWLAPAGDTTLGFRIARTVKLKY